MSTAIREQDLQMLCHKFGVPELVQKWLNETKDTHTANEYLLHEDICNMHPEDALLCIALCLKMIERKYSSAASHLKALKPLIAEIISSYGENALNRTNNNISQTDREDIEFVARDLRELAHRLENIEPYLFENGDDVLSIILSALSIQAGAQAEIASYVLANFKEQEKKNKKLEADVVPFLKTLPVNDNKSAG